MMVNIQYNLQFEKICSILQLGEITRVPLEVAGGFLHRMYAIETTLGKYAIKALNPQIMLRPVAMQNYIHSEQIATISANHIPALPAKKFRGTSLQEIDNQYYLVFDWVEGKSLRCNEIKEVHCEQIGAVLADIHMTDFSELGIINDRPEHVELTDWCYYLQKGQENNLEWSYLLLEYIGKLNEWNALSNKSAKLLVKDMVISHRDLDSKNVMWHQDNPILIDWESAGYINPMQDLVETAIYWSQNEAGSVDKERFFVFIGGYKKKYGTLEADWKIVLANGFSGKLGWLEYSLKRSLWIECTDEDEQKMGIAQVTGTINDIRRYADMINELEEWLLE
ncbi:aminoglycoside phosphotransferase family protein [Paenibacillus wynnii]